MATEHCKTCGEPVVPAGAGHVHESAPPGLDPAVCVTGTSDGKAYGGEDTAELCTDPGCPTEEGPPWWEEYVR